MRSKYVGALSGFILLLWNPFGAKAEVRVGMLLPLSGSYAAVGADNRQGIEAALELSAYKIPLKLDFADSKADATAAVALGDYGLDSSSHDPRRCSSAIMDASTVVISMGLNHQSHLQEKFKVQSKLFNQVAGLSDAPRSRYSRSFTI